MRNGITPDTKPIKEPDCTCSVCVPNLIKFTYNFQESLSSLGVGYYFRVALQKFGINYCNNSRVKDVYDFLINATTEQIIELASASETFSFKFLCKYAWLMIRIDDVDKAKTFVEKIAKIPNSEITEFVTSYVFTFEIAHMPKYRKYFYRASYSDDIPAFLRSWIQLRGRDAATLLYQFPNTPDDWFKSYDAINDSVGIEGIHLVKKFREFMIMGDDGYVTVNRDALTIGTISIMLDYINSYTFRLNHIPLQLINAFNTPLLIGIPYFDTITLISAVLGDSTIYSECLKKTPGWAKVLFPLWEKNEKISCYQIFDIMCQPYTIKPEQPATPSVLTKLTSVFRNVVARFRRS